MIIYKTTRRDIEYLLPVIQLFFILSITYLFFILSLYVTCASNKYVQGISIENSLEELSYLKTFKDKTLENLIGNLPEYVVSQEANIFCGTDSQTMALVTYINEVYKPNVDVVDWHLFSTRFSTIEQIKVLNLGGGGDLSDIVYSSYLIFVFEELEDNLELLTYLKNSGQVNVVNEELFQNIRGWYANYLSKDQAWEYYKVRYNVPAKEEAYILLKKYPLIKLPSDTIDWSNDPGGRREWDVLQAYIKHLANR